MCLSINEFDPILDLSLVGDFCSLLNLITQRSLTAAVLYWPQGRTDIHKLIPEKDPILNTNNRSYHPPQDKLQLHYYHSYHSLQSYHYHSWPNHSMINFESLWSAKTCSWQFATDPPSSTALYCVLSVTACSAIPPIESTHRFWLQGSAKLQKIPINLSGTETHARLHGLITTNWPGSICPDFYEDRTAVCDIPSYTDDYCAVSAGNMPHFIPSSMVQGNFMGVWPECGSEQGREWAGKWWTMLEGVNSLSIKGTLSEWTRTQETGEWTHMKATDWE